jgi:hypothetical protein
MTRRIKMTTDVKSIVVNGIEYVQKSEAQEMAVSTDGLKYVICRTYSAGVFAGYLKKREGQEVTLIKARRLWYWDGAASLSQAANEGFSKPQNCKFPAEVEEVLLLNAIEILPTTIKAEKNIKGVSVWKL